MEKTGAILKHGPTSQTKPTRPAITAKVAATGQATQLPASAKSVSAPKLIRGGEVGQSEPEIREDLTELRKRGLRNFRKYGPEPWEPPLTAEERERFK